MKALSIRQPWAWAILHLGKRVENRNWDISAYRAAAAYRGPVLLHASKNVGTRADFDSAADGILDACEEAAGNAFRDEHLDIGTSGPGSTPAIWLPRRSLQRGGIVGRAEIVGVLRSERELVAYSEASPYAFDCKRQIDWYTGGFALILAVVQPLPFVPWPGALGLFDVPDDYAARAAGG